MTATLTQWLRHHLAAITATAADYVVMVTGVEVARLPPVPATMAGAMVGALVSLTLGRRYTYRVGSGRIITYAWRYAVVAGVSLGWNAGGEALFHHVLGVQYVVARVITSIIVSNLWNYPMHRFFVFARPRPPATEPPS